MARKTKKAFVSEKIANYLESEDWMVLEHKEYDQDSQSNDKTTLKQLYKAFKIGKKAELTWAKKNNA